MQPIKCAKPRPKRPSKTRIRVIGLGVAIYEDISECPACGAHLDREFDHVYEGEELVEYTTCSGREAHRWRVLGVYRDRSVWFYRLSGRRTERGSAT